MMIDDEELRLLYDSASQEHLQKLKQGLRQLAQHPQDDAVAEELRRAAHTLKGDSKSVGLDAIAVPIQRLEEILKHIRNEPAALTPDLQDRLEQGLDTIGRLVQEAVTGEPSGVNPDDVLNHVIAADTAATAAFEMPLALPDQPRSVMTELDAASLTGPGGTDTLETAPMETTLAGQNPAIWIEDDDLRQLYHIASQERLEKLKEGLLQLQQYPQDSAILDELRREAHSFKGDSSSVGLDSVAVLIHQVEDILTSSAQGEVGLTPELQAQLDCGLDQIGQLVQEAVTGQPSGVDPIDVFNQLVAAAAEAQSLQLAVSPPPNQVLLTTPTSPLIEDAELREIYRVSSQERLQRLEAGLLHLEKFPDDTARLEHLLREAHSLKGDARSVGQDMVEALIHQVEEILGGIKRNQALLTPRLSDCLYEALDAIGLLVQEAVTGQSSAVDTAELLNRLIAAVPAASLQELDLPPSETVSPPAQALIKAAKGDAVPSEPDESYLVDSIRVSTRDLDALMTQAEELTVTKIAIANMTAQIEQLETLWDDWKASTKKGRSSVASLHSANPYQEQLEKIIHSLRATAQENSTKLGLITGELRERIRTLRLLPLSTVLQLLPRMVRDLAKQQAKEIDLIMEGGEITVDKRILEDIKDALMHIVRNAVDHGIELPADRERLGKSRTATLYLRGYQTGSTIVLEIADDGRGLDTEKIKQTAIKRGLYSREELAAMTESQIHALIFAPGFSTRTFITEISGRGIGLDVVRTNIERLKGTIQIESTFGQGCLFRIQLSTALSTIDAMLMQVQGIVHALPLEFVKKTLLISPEQIVISGDRPTITLDDQTVPVANLADLLELSNSPVYASVADLNDQKSDSQACILLNAGKEQAGFLVDRLLDTQEVVLRPQSQLLKRVRNVSGATILPTGEVCTILNPLDLLKSLQKQANPALLVKPKPPVKRKPVILLVDDSVPVRTQEQRLLERAGYEVVTAVDGLDGYSKLKTRPFDAVISDVEMPHLDGLSMTAKIRQLPEFSDLPIILVTTLASDADRKRGADAGASAYVIKGKFNQDVLLEILGRLVSYSSG